MRPFLTALFIAPAFAATAASAECPAAPDHIASVAAVIGEIQAAGNERAARQMSGRLWELWTDAPDEIAQTLLDQGMSKRRAADYLGAMDDLNRLVDYCPNYAEGYNQRAFVNFLSQNFAPALEDLDRAIELSPNHVAALAGRALTLVGLERFDEAREALLFALELNPWLSERHLMAPGGILAPKGKDI